MGTVLGDGHGARLRQIEYLAGDEAGCHRCVQRRAASSTGLGEMVDGGVGVFNLAQGLAWVAALSAGRLARGLAQALRAWRLLQPIAGRRLAAVAAVLAKLALQLRDAACQRGNQFLQHLDLYLLCRDDLLRRRKGGRSSVINWLELGIRWRRHEELDSCPESRVKPLTDPDYLGSYDLPRSPFTFLFSRGAPPVTRYSPDERPIRTSLRLGTTRAGQGAASSAVIAGAVRKFFAVISASVVDAEECIMISMGNWWVQ